VNWKTPGEISGTLPITLQLLKGNKRLVVVNAVKPTPGVLVKPNRNAPLANRVLFIKRMGSVAEAAELSERYISALVRELK
jgi:hypothetical protein